MATLRSPDLLYIIHGNESNDHFPQAVGDTSFPLWLTDDVPEGGQQYETRMD